MLQSVIPMYMTTALNALLYYLLCRRATMQTILSAITVHVFIIIILMMHKLTISL